MLDLLLGTHTKVASLGEISHLPKNISLNTICTCGEPVQSCQLWKEVLNRISYSIGVDIRINPYAFNLGAYRAKVVVDKSHQTPGYVIKRKLLVAQHYLKLKYGLPMLPYAEQTINKINENNFLLYKAVAETLNVDTVIDSSKSYLKGLGLYKEYPHNVRIILLVRDGRAVFYSGVKRQYARKQCVTVWKHVYERALPLLRRHVEERHMSIVHYEDLAADPAKELTRICDFCEMDFESGMLDFTSKEHHITNGNDMRLGNISEIRVDNSWMDNLSSKDLRYFESIAGNLNRSLGYE